MNFLYFFISFIFFIFYQSTVLSSHAAGGHQMYFGGSVTVVGKASTIAVAHPSPNFHREGDKNVRNWRRLKHHSTLSHSHLKMQQDIRILKQKCNAAMIAPCPGQVW